MKSIKIFLANTYKNLYYCSLFVTLRNLDNPFYKNKVDDAILALVERFQKIDVFGLVIFSSNHN